MGVSKVLFFGSLPIKNRRRCVSAVFMSVRLAWVAGWVLEMKSDYDPQ
jgi:hypothetical protein